MIGRRQHQSLLAASLFSWLILFTLPFVSGQVNNGTEWVQLCTQSGLKLVPIETNTTSVPSSLHSLDCPCLSHSLQTAELNPWLADFHALEVGTFDTLHVSIQQHYLLPPLRAPPIV